MTRALSALFAALTLAAWALSAAAITDPYWPNVNARIEAEQLQRMIGEAARSVIDAAR